MKSILIILFSFLLGNSIWILMSESLLANYANTIGILALGIFTVIWTNRAKKDVKSVKDEMGEIHHKIDGMRENELRVTKDLGESVGAEAGRLQKRAEDREDKIDNINLSGEPVKVIVDQPADVNIVEDKTKN